jgi:hypothetical protein
MDMQSLFSFSEQWSFSELLFCSSLYKQSHAPSWLPTRNLRFYNALLSGRICWKIETELEIGTFSHLS